MNIVIKHPYAPVYAWSLSVPVPQVLGFGSPQQSLIKGARPDFSFRTLGLGFRV